MRALVYLAGPMAGRSDEDCHGWRDRATEILRPSGVGVLNPMLRDFRAADLSLEEARKLVADDKADIRKAGAVVVRADSGASYGTCMEVLYACDVAGKPVVAYVGDADVSPWLLAHATVVETLEDACAEAVAALASAPAPRPRTIADEIAAFKAQGPSPLLVKALNRLMDLHCPHCGEAIGTEFEL